MADDVLDIFEQLRKERRPYVAGSEEAIPWPTHLSGPVPEDRFEPAAPEEEEAPDPVLDSFDKLRETPKSAVTIEAAAFFEAAVQLAEDPEAERKRQQGLLYLANVLNLDPVYAYNNEDIVGQLYDQTQEVPDLGIGMVLFNAIHAGMDQMELSQVQGAMKHGGETEELIAREAEIEARMESAETYDLKGIKKVIWGAAEFAIGQTVGRGAGRGVLGEMADERAAGGAIFQLGVLPIAVAGLLKSSQLGGNTVPSLANLATKEGRSSTAAAIHLGFLVASGGRGSGEVEGNISYRGMTKAGVPREVALQVSLGPEILNGLLETVQFTTLLAGFPAIAGLFKKSVAKAVTSEVIVPSLTRRMVRVGIETAGRWGVETVTEGTQEWITATFNNMAVDVANGMDGVNISDDEKINAWWMAWETMKQVAAPMGLVSVLPMPFQVAQAIRAKGGTVDVVVADETYGDIDLLSREKAPEQVIDKEAGAPAETEVTPTETPEQKIQRAELAFSEAQLVDTTEILELLRTAPETLGVKPEEVVAQTEEAERLLAQTEQRRDEILYQLGEVPDLTREEVGEKLRQNFGLTQREVEINLVVLDARAAKLGVSTEEYLNTGFGAKPGTVGGFAPEVFGEGASEAMAAQEQVLEQPRSRILKQDLSDAVKAYKNKTQRELPEMPVILESKRSHPAVKTDDGGIYADALPHSATHVEFIRKLGIPPERIVSGGWITEGVYEASERSDTVRFVERYKAQIRVAAKRGVDAVDLLYQTQPRPVAATPDPQLARAAVETFGTTTNAHAAGFILPTGEMLDMGHKKKTRDIEHHQVAYDLGVAARTAEGELMDEGAVTELMTESGMVRWAGSFGTFRSQEAVVTFATKPTYQQIQSIVVGMDNMNTNLLSMEWVNSEGNTLAWASMSNPEAKDIQRFVNDPQRFQGEMLYQPRRAAPAGEGRQPWEMTREEFAIQPPRGYQLGKLAAEDIARAEADGTITIDPDNFFGQSQEVRKDIIEHEQAHFVEEQISPEYKARLFDNRAVMDYRGRNINKKLANMIQDGALPAEILADYPDLAKPARLYQPGKDPKAAIEFTEQGKAILHASEQSDVSSAIHEFLHAFERELDPEQRAVAESEYGIKPGEAWTREQHERFAADGENYLMTGEHPNAKLAEVFRKFAEWLKAIYQGLRGKVKMSPELKALFDSLFAEPDTAFDFLMAEKAREMSKDELVTYMAETEEVPGDTVAMEQFWEDTRERDRVAAEAAESPPAPTETQADRTVLADSVEDPEEKKRILKGSDTAVSLIKDVRKLEKQIVKQDEKIAKLEARLKTVKGEQQAKVQAAIKKEKARKKELEANARTRKKQREHIRKQVKRILREPQKKMDSDYKDRLRSMQVQLRPRNRRADIQAKVKEQREFYRRNPEALGGLTARQVREIFQKAPNELTVAEIDAMAEESARLRQVGKWKFDMIKGQEDRRHRANVAGAKAILAAQQKEPPAPEGPITGQPSEGLLRPLRTAKNLFVHPERQLDSFDGGILFGGKSGLFHELFWNQRNEAKNEKIRHMNRRKDKAKAMLAEIGMKEKDFTKTRKVLGDDYSVSTMMHVVMGWRNDKNRAALQYGNKFTEAHYEAFAKGLSEKEMAVAEWILQEFEQEKQRVRDAFHALYPDLEWVDEDSYIPMPRLNRWYETPDTQMATEVLAKENVGRVGVEKGFTFTRQDISEERQTPIRMGLWEAWLGALPIQEHLAAYGKLVRDMRKVQENREVQDLMQQTKGIGSVKWLKNYIDDIAQPNLYQGQNAIDGISRIIRHGVTSAFLSFNPLVYARQTVSILYYTSYAGPKAFLEATGAVAFDYRKTRDFVYARAPQIKNRMMDPFFEELKGAPLPTNAKQWEKVLKKIEKGVQKVGKVGTAPIGMFDHITVLTGWMAVYNSVLSKTQDPALAIQEATNVTLRTQPTGGTGDMPQWYRSGEGARWLSMFTRQLNQITNMATYDLPQQIRHHKVQQAIVTAVSLGMGAFVIGAVGRKRLPKNLKELGIDQLKGIFNLIPIIGKEIVSGMDGWEGGSALPFMEVGVEMGRGVKSLMDGTFEWKDVLDIAFAFGTVSGMPTAFMKRVINTIKERDFRRMFGALPKEPE